MALDNNRIVIIGAGPCGQGAAWRLHELGFENYTVFEKIIMWEAFPRALAMRRVLPGILAATYIAYTMTILTALWKRFCPKTDGYHTNAKAGYG